LKTGVITTVLGDGKRGALSRPHGLLYAGGILYISDSENHRILQITPQ
jgi:hypothetical protein